jgi:hypothetical protein
MDALKRSPEPIAMRALYDIFGRDPGVNSLGDRAGVCTHQRSFVLTATR